VVYCKKHENFPGKAKLPMGIENFERIRKEDEYRK